MKRSIVSILLCTACLWALTACGGKTDSSVPAASQEPETFGVTELPSESPAQVQNQSPAATNQPETQGDAGTESDALNLQLAAAVLCQADGLSYDPEDPIYFWRAVGYLAGMTAQDGPGQATENQGVYQLSQADIQVYIQAMFGDYAGEIPSVTEEDPVVSMAENGDYLIHAPQTAVTLTSLTVSDGQAHLEAAENGQTLGSYTVALTEYTGPQNGKDLFRYSITGVTKQN